MPQLGETVTEGTITKWFKKVGDRVERDELLFEVSTDKVDSEVTSPASGVLTEIRIEEGATVDVGHDRESAVRQRWGLREWSPQVQGFRLLKDNGACRGYP